MALMHGEGAAVTEPAQTWWPPLKAEESPEKRQAQRVLNY